MTEAPKTPAEGIELRTAAPHKGGPLESSGAAPSESSEAASSDKTDKTDKSEKPGEGPKVGAMPQVGAMPAEKATPDTVAVPKQRSKEDAAKPAEAAKPSDAGKPSEAAKSDAAGKKEPAAKAAAGEGSSDGKGDPGKAAGATAGNTAGAAVTKTRRFRPVHVAGRAGKATAGWAKGPSGRVIIPGFVIVALVVLAGTSGAYLVPKALDAAPAPSATPTFGGEAAAAASAAPGGLPGDPAAGLTGLPTGLPTDLSTGLPTGVTTGVPTVGATGLPGITGLPTGLPTGLSTTQPAVGGARPADALASWATQVGTQVGIPVVAVQAYGYAELVTAKTTPACHLSWTTLAAIAKVESEHGSHNGAVLGVDGVSTPTIYGLQLDGKGGRMLITDTDQGQLDGDPTFDRAIGPMQFIPATWKESAVDADNDGVKNPNDIDDAAMTAAVYLCKGGRDLTKAESWWDAILSYNAVRPYAQKVFQFADDYGRRSRG
ncbi:hypothetical protein FB565_005673 [Actinoplanes lutulentus]|uniref:lytic transglycosylase domain-containing protein n=1 Tax=Actinoplanes lutulentus TaxID=1287878 RepID=UPI00179053EC|nr:lytic murein transglycosylase [Actinoplanes lutulentus]MBB2945915.1 hypothetical protein [Actinoplanes lutulentus]